MVKRMTTLEEDEQMMLVKYLRWQYPNILYKCDLAGVKLSIGSAVKQKKLGNVRAYPDLFFPEPRGGYYGLFIEMKRTNVKIFKKNGEPVSDHIAEQVNMIDALNRKGYKAAFAIGFDEAKKLVDEYFKGEEKW